MTTNNSTKYRYISPDEQAYDAWWARAEVEAKFMTGYKRDMIIAGIALVIIIIVLIL